jgi:Helix-turn-helix domain
LPSVLTLEEVAEYLRLPIESVREHAVQGLILGNEINGEWRFLKSAIDQWLVTPRASIELDFTTAQSNNDEILALIASWDTPEQEEHQTQTWNTLKIALANSEGLRARDTP